MLNKHAMKLMPSEVETLRCKSIYSQPIGDAADVNVVKELLVYASEDIMRKLSRMKQRPHNLLVVVLET
jgi:hypothetical protein